MPRIKKATDANGNVFYPINISKAVYDTDRNQRLNDTLSDIYNALFYFDVYIGAAAASSTIIANVYHHDSVTRGKPLAISNADEDYIWVILPTTYTPLVTLSGIEVHMIQNGTTSIDEVTYKIYKSEKTFSGTFNVQLF